MTETEFHLRKADLDVMNLEFLAAWLVNMLIKAMSSSVDKKKEIDVYTVSNFMSKFVGNFITIYMKRTSVPAS